MNPTTAIILLASLAVMQYACIFVLKRTNASLCSLNMDLVTEGEKLVTEFDKLEARNAHLESCIQHRRQVLAGSMLYALMVSSNKLSAMDGVGAP